MLSHPESSAAQFCWIQHTSTLFYTGIKWGNFLATVGQICLAQGHSQGAGSLEDSCPNLKF